MLKFLNAVDITSTKTISLVDANIKGILLRWTGNNKTGQQLNISHLGYLRINKEVPMVNALLSDLFKFCKVAFGQTRELSSQGGAFDFSVYVPFYNPFSNTDNCVLFSKNDYLIADGLDTSIVQSATLSIYYDEDYLNNLYIPSIFTRSETLSSEKPIYLPDKNIMLLWYSQPATPPTKIIITKNNAVAWDTPSEVLEIYTNIIGRHEQPIAGTEDFVVINMSNNLLNSIGNFYCQTVGGSGTLTYTTFGINLTSANVNPFLTNPLVSLRNLESRL